MSKSILVVAPHPDDESLGCGGTLLKHINNGDEVHWLIITSMSLACGYSQQQINKRRDEIKVVSQLFNFSSVTVLDFPPASLDSVDTADLVGAISKNIKATLPHTVYLPYRYDVHSDHKAVFDAAMSSTKSFRAASVKRLLCYETLSETDFNLDPNHAQFSPNVWVDINDFLEQKINILKTYQSELSEFPFPRSLDAVEALAKVRGVQCNSKAAEAFMLLKEII